MMGGFQCDCRRNEVETAPKPEIPPVATNHLPQVCRLGFIGLRMVHLEVSTWDCAVLVKLVNWNAAIFVTAFPVCSLTLITAINDIPASGAGLES